METLALTPQMIVVMFLLLAIILLFITEVVRIDLAALSIMIVLGLLSLVPSMDGLIDPAHLFDGFASNAVVGIMAVMILGAGLEKTGLMHRVAVSIVRLAGQTERRLIPVLSLVAGLVSGFIQNAGAATLFLPILSRISVRTNIALSRFLMPVGFCILLGGTITLVGSSPLVIINDLLPPSLDPFGLFDVVWVGLALLFTGILFFATVGRRMVPTIRDDAAARESTMNYLERVYGLDFVIHEIRLEKDSLWEGCTILDVEQETGCIVIATFMRGELRMGPWSGLTLEPRAYLAILGHENKLAQLAASRPDLRMQKGLDIFSNALSSLESGIAEVVIPPNSELTGQSIKQIAMRRTYGLSVLAVHRGDETIRHGLRDMVLKAGDTLVCHCAWEALGRVQQDADFVVVTSAFPREELRPQKRYAAVAFFLFAIGLALFTNLRISIAFFAGAIGMILSGVLTIDEAYRAITWRTVFLLGSLIPLGQAVENTGTAMWIAQQALQFLQQPSPIVLQLLIAVLTTLFTLVMSNVGATVLLVPFAIHLAWAAQADGLAADPRVFALTVAIVATNGFLLPTNQVMSIYVGPGGYRVKDFMRVGLVMSVLFIIVAMVMLNVVF